MNAQNKKILERYGRIKSEMTMSYLGNPNMENLKLKMAKVLLDMELNDLTKQDYTDYKNSQNKEAQNQRLAEKDKSAKKTINKGILFLGLGLLFILCGIGFTEFTNSSITLYGMILFGIGLIISGLFEIYIFIKLK